ncbi:hypothetical protein SCB49_00130 [unidentified eubacterium SCB49]|nr:hypothetical protein SCB49_00130 [unidentified eubacterium SCB49]
MIYTKTFWRLSFVLLFITTITSCNTNKSDIFDDQKICSCYQNSERNNHQSKIIECLQPIIETAEKKAIDEGISANLYISAMLDKTTIKLFKNCALFQEEFNQDYLSKYDTKNETEKLFRKKALNDILTSGVTTPKNQIQVAIYQTMEANYDEAISIFSTLDKTDEYLIDIYNFRAFIYHQKGEFKKALNELKKLEAEATKKGNVKMLDLAKTWILNVNQEIAKSKK